MKDIFSFLSKPVGQTLPSLGSSLDLGEKTQTSTPAYVPKVPKSPLAFLSEPLNISIPKDIHDTVKVPTAPKLSNTSPLSFLSKPISSVIPSVAPAEKPNYLKQGYDAAKEIANANINPLEAAKMTAKGTYEVGHSTLEGLGNFLSDLGNTFLNATAKPALEGITGKKAPYDGSIHFEHEVAPGMKPAHVSGEIIGGALPYILGGEALKPVSMALEASGPLVKTVGKVLLNTLLPAAVQQTAPLKEGETRTSRFVAGLPSNLTFGATSLIPNQAGSALATGFSQMGIGAYEGQKLSENLMNSAILTLFGFAGHGEVHETAESLRTRAQDILDTDLGKNPHPNDLAVQEMAQQYLNQNPEEQTTFIHQAKELAQKVIDKYNRFAQGTTPGFVRMENPFAPKEEGEISAKGEKDRNGKEDNVLEENRGENVDALYRQLDRAEQSLQARNENPEAHQEAYKVDKGPEYVAEIQRLKDKIAEATKDHSPTLPEGSEEPLPLGEEGPSAVGEGTDQSFSEYQKAEQDMQDRVAQLKNLRDSGSMDKEQFEVETAKMERAFAEDAIKSDDARSLSKFASKGRLPEVTGEGPGKFSQFGDDFAKTAGFPSSEDARSAYEKYVEKKKEYQETRDRVREKVKEYTDKKAVLAELKKEISSEARSRNESIKTLAEFFGLTKAELAEIQSGKSVNDLRLMSDEQFDNFLKEIEGKATELFVNKQLRYQVQETIRAKQLLKVENLRKAMKLPEIENMSSTQLKEFDDLLNTFEQGDQFLGQKKLETIDRTPLKGVRTYREAKEALARELSKKVGREVKPEELNNITGWQDRFSWDTALAERNPFYKLVVEDTNASLLEGEGRVLEIEEKVNEMMKRVHKGTGFANKLVPRDNNIVEYLESPYKETVSQNMSQDEYDAAEFMRKYYADSLNYLYEQKALQKSRFEDVYYTHMRRSFLEALADTPGSWKTKIGTALRELVEKQKLEKTIVDILDQKTGQILPMDKYFKYVTKREGTMTPSKNVAKVFMEYVKMMETKKALDRIVPEIMTYVDVLTPPKETRTGLKMDDKLKSFITEYINNKKGRRATLGFTQGSKPDLVLKSIGAFISIRDLGVNVAVQLGSNAGALGGVYTLLGPGDFAKGLWRYKATLIPQKYASETVAKTKDILEQSRAYTGKNPWSELADISKDVGDKVHSAMFVLFRDAVVRANQIHLLGSLTKEEWDAGKISSERLAQLKLSAGRWLPVEKGESVYGSTTVGKAGTKYKTWAIVMAHRTASNIKEVVKMGARLQGKKLYESREGSELVNATVFTGAAALIAWSLARDSDKKKGDMSFVSKVEDKLLQDALSFIQALNPVTLLSTPRLMSFMQSLGTGLLELATMEKYKASGDGYKKGDLKGTKVIKKAVTPNIVSTIDGLLNELHSVRHASSQATASSKGRLAGIKLVKKNNLGNIKLQKKSPGLKGIKLGPKKKLNVKLN